MKKYAIYWNGVYFLAFESYWYARIAASALERPMSVVEIVDMTDGVLCYRWVY